MLVWLVFLGTWLPILWDETRYTSRGETSYIEIVMPRIMSFALFLFFSAWFAGNSIMLFPSQHKLMHVYLSLEISDSLVPIHKSAFQFLSERNSLNCPHTKDFPILFPRSNGKRIVFSVLSLCLPIFGMIPRLSTHNQFCLDKWKAWMCIIVTFNDSLLWLLTYVVLSLFDTIIIRSQAYFKDVTLITDLLILRDFHEQQSSASSNLLKNCFRCCFATQDDEYYLKKKIKLIRAVKLKSGAQMHVKIDKHNNDDYENQVSTDSGDSFYTSEQLETMDKFNELALMQYFREKSYFLRLNSEQNQLAWFEMRLYV